MFDVVGVVAKPGIPLARELSRQVIAWLKQRGYRIRVEREIATELGLQDVEPELFIERSELTNQCRLIIVLGGDGTLISVSRHPAEQPPTIIGINLGTLGFLTEITTDELFPILELSLAERAPLERRFLLRATVTRRHEELATYHAVNDVVVTKEALARIFGLKITVNSHLAAVLRGDGVIVATPGASTAYSLSAGGSIVHPQVEAILLTPICPHSLTSRPLVLPGNSDITLQTVSQKPGSTDQVYLTIDGQDGMELTHADEVLITTSTNSVYYVKSPSRNYFEVLGAKLKWANPVT